MSLLAFLSSAVGGTLLSGVQQWVQEWMATRRAKAESEMRLAEAKALSDIKMDENQWAAFTEAQKQAGTSSWVPTDNTPKSLVYAFGLSEVFIKLVRPMMVVGSFAFLFYIYQQTTDAEQAELNTSICTFCFSVGYFWIGQRYQSKLMTGPTKK